MFIIRHISGATNTVADWMSRWLYLATKGMTERLPPTPAPAHPTPDLKALEAVADDPDCCFAYLIADLSTGPAYACDQSFVEFDMAPLLQRHLAPSH